MAPELCRGVARSSKAADIYAFGMVVYEVITGARPFGQRALNELLFITTQGWRPARPESPADMFDQEMWEFIEKCWDEDSEQRPTAEEALEHFECVAATSTDVDPGPVLAARGAVVEMSSGLDTGSRSFRECRRCLWICHCTPL